uniref:Uncharacterized protein n=1 Tax=Psilocybe cubensis TaxID=181762 RepID=A0A8H7XTI9_PSICU
MGVTDFQEEILDNSVSPCGSELERKENSAANLHPTAFKAYLIGRNKLLYEVHKTIIGPGCLNNAQCATRKSETIASLRTVKNFNYICALDEVKVPSNVPVCRICRLSLERTIHEMRQEMWKNLPSMFGLSQWEELKDFERGGW